MARISTHGAVHRAWGLEAAEAGDLALLSPALSPRACVGLPPQNHMLLEHKMERPGLGIKRVGSVATTCPLPCKKGPAPTAPNGYTGDANGHPQAEAPQMPTA